MPVSRAAILLGLCCVLLTSISPSRCFPNKLPERIDHHHAEDDQLIDPYADPLADYDRMDEEFVDRGGWMGGSDNGTEEAAGCPHQCDPEMCPEARGCRAGLVLDACGCCKECANLEGQACDLGGRNAFYGLCGTGLRCQTEERRRGGGGGGDEESDDELLCRCVEQEAVCGSDGKTYMNMCQFREVSFSKPQLTAGRGPCETAPIIKVRPQSQVNETGSSLMFLCEVFAYPMATVEWMKDGVNVILPGDDPHISVQSRGGPMKFELSSWLQIEKAGQEDSGTYHCVARNNMGSASASAVLGVLNAEEMSVFLTDSLSEMKELMDYSHPRDYGQDYY